MAWAIDFAKTAECELEKLDIQNARRIIKFFTEQLPKHDNPRAVGKALQGEKYKTLWRYRIGDYRAIASIEDCVMRVLVVEIGHRSDIYKG